VEIRPHCLTRRLGEKADGAGGEKQKVIGLADDFENADGEHVLSFDQALDVTRAWARDTVANAPATWEQAIDDYEADLKTRGGNKDNATHIRFHLTRGAAALLKKTVALLTAAELKRWRNDLVANSGLKLSSVVRLLKSACASLNLAASHDPRITNREAWRVGLGGLHDSYAAINRVQPDIIVRQIIVEADSLDPAFGLFVRTAAETGARSVQLARLEIADLQAKGAEPKLLMPSSRKGRKRQITVPISPDLAARLKHAAGKRAPDEPLLLRADGKRWDSPGKRRFVQEPFAAVAERVGICETLYCLRHSAIVRALLAGVPAQLVASNHDTSLRMCSRLTRGSSAITVSTLRAARCSPLRRRPWPQSNGDDAQAPTPPL
jgi:integrase